MPHITTIALTPSTPSQPVSLVGYLERTAVRLHPANELA